MSIPEVFFRETIDLNRYSNAVSKDFVQTYNDVILTAAKKLKQIDIRQKTADAGVVISPQTRKRLRAIIQQSKYRFDLSAQGQSAPLTLGLSPTLRYPSLSNVDLASLVPW